MRTASSVKRTQENYYSNPQPIFPGTNDRGELDARPSIVRGKDARLRRPIIHVPCFVSPKTVGVFILFSFFFFLFFFKCIVKRVNHVFRKHASERVERADVIGASNRVRQEFRRGRERERERERGKKNPNSLGAETKQNNLY